MIIWSYDHMTMWSYDHMIIWSYDINARHEVLIDWANVARCVNNTCKPTWANMATESIHVIIIPCDHYPYLSEKRSATAIPSRPPIRNAARKRRPKKPLHANAYEPSRYAFLHTEPTLTCRLGSIFFQAIRILGELVKRVPKALSSHAPAADAR